MLTSRDLQRFTAQRNNRNSINLTAVGKTAAVFAYYIVVYTQEKCEKIININRSKSLRSLLRL